MALTQDDPLCGLHLWVPPELSWESEPQDFETLPLVAERALSKAEKYLCVSALHDGICKAVERIDPWGVLETKPKHIGDAGVYAQYESKAATAPDDHRGPFESFLTQIESDLKANVPEHDGQQGAETKSSKQKHGKRGGPSDTDPKVEFPKRFEFRVGQVLFDGKDLKVPTGMMKEVLQELVKQFGLVVPFKKLDMQSKDTEGSEQLRKAVSRLNNDVFKARHVPVRIENRKGEGYVILPAKT